MLCLFVIVWNIEHDFIEILEALRENVAQLDYSKCAKCIVRHFMRR